MLVVCMHQGCCQELPAQLPVPGKSCRTGHRVVMREQHAVVRPHCHLLNRITAPSCSQAVIVAGLAGQGIEPANIVIEDIATALGAKVRRVDDEQRFLLEVEMERANE